ncbi:thioesterase domain-containing protein [Asanoa sp. NPDC049518]|uniref:thioesterase domain-containing protein n=1 Tax=unclassified Asanoa TaxID=2685164 RepID=UPI0034140A84
MLDSDDAVAIVGLAARHTGADDLERLWLDLVRGREPDGALPEPTTVALAEVAYAALEDAAARPTVGVFAADGAAEVARALGVTGPVVAADGFRAVHLAGAALRDRTCALALVGGAGHPGGVCVVALKRLSDALADHDHVWAVIRDGVPAGGELPSDVGYVEVCGDVTAVAVAGHRVGQVSGGGLAGIVKVALALEREQLPPSALDPRLELAGTPFVGQDRVAPWPRDPSAPRVAAVAAGEAGFVVLSEAPARALTMHAEEPRVLVWSGRTATEERVVRERLAHHLVWRGEEVFADAVATLQHARTVHPVRAAAVCTGALDAAGVLGAVDSPRVLAPAPTEVTLVFPGGAPATAVAALHRAVPAFAEAFDGWLELLGDPGPPETVLFAAEAALAQVWLAAGVRPAALAADGVGVLAAAAVAEVLTPADAAALVRVVADAGELERAVAGVALKPPTIPLHCGPGGPAVTATDAGDPAFWARAVLARPGHRGGVSTAPVRPGALLTSAASLWTQGHDLDWTVLGQQPLRHRVPMPVTGLRPATRTPSGHPLEAARTRVRRGAAPLGIDLLTEPGSGPLVLAIPYAGGSGRAFQAMRRYLPSGCGLALVDLPGHGRRMGDPCLRDVDAVVDELLAVLPTLPSERLLLLGYSLGGSFSYELAARLTDAGTPPEGVVVCGSRSPQTGVGHPPVAHLPLDDFLHAAVDMGLAAREMLELPELAASFAAPLQADLAMVETFPYRPLRPPVPVPAAVVGLRGDWIVPEPSLRAWDDLFRDPPLQLRVDGGHLALHEREQEFGVTVHDAVEHLLAETVRRPLP